MVTKVQAARLATESGVTVLVAGGPTENVLVRALKGRSLLPAGVVRVKGPFHRGDSVNIVGPEGKTIACGVVNYSAADLERIKGERSAAITPILGFHFGDEVIHRNNVVML
jgi:glutamate 5-kinase